MTPQQMMQQRGNVAGVQKKHLPYVEKQQEQYQDILYEMGSGGLQGGGDLSELVTDTITFLLSPTIPREYRNEFNRWLLVINKIGATSYIKEDSLLAFLSLFRLIQGYYRAFDYESARETSAEFLFILNLCRSIDGRMLDLLNTIRTEKVSYYPDAMPQKQGFWKTLRKGFSGGRR